MHTKTIARVLGALLPLVGVCAVSVDARAQSRVSGSNSGGMDTHLFRAALDSKGFFSVDGTDIMGHKDFSFGLVMDYGSHLMRLNAVDRKSVV